MKLLVDTQVFIWLTVGDKRIGTKAYDLLQDTTNQVNLSYFSLFEMKIKASIGKLSYDDSVVGDLPRMGIELLMPTIDMLDKYTIESHDNRDPFDNVLIAAARSENCLFVTADPKILAVRARDLALHDARV